MLRAALTLYDALLGLTLLFTPWTRYWQDNWFLWQTGSFQSYLMSGPVRGAISGFGAAFLISAAGRLAGIGLVEEEDVVSSETRLTEDGSGAGTTDSTPSEAAVTHLENGNVPDPALRLGHEVGAAEATLEPDASAATVAGVRER